MPTVGSASLSLCLYMEPVNCTVSLQYKDPELASLANSVFCIFNIELWFGVK